VNTISTSKVRFAQADDFIWCISGDNLVSPEVIERKMELNEIIVVEFEEQLVGYLRLEYLWSTLPYIGVIFVHEAYQRQGVGRAIIDFLAAFLRENGHKVLLSSSQVNEPEAQAWHRAIGFHECGILAGLNEGGIGEVFFRKVLT
jgi:ribosomal protein S18 acetylase RimI-like enzyme